jgi:hypothetical protein
MVGNIFATILILIVIFSIMTTIFNLLFRDGRGIGLYGSRGEFYMSE